MSYAKKPNYSAVIGLLLIALAILVFVLYIGARIHCAERHGFWTHYQCVESPYIRTITP